MRRSRLPWLVLALESILFAATMVLTIQNGSFTDPFIYLAVAMVVGYSAVGAVVASRRPDNAVGWLMMAVGVSFLLVGFSDEYVRYVYGREIGSLPFPTAVAWIGNWSFNPVTGSILLMAVLYPTGRSPSPGWRFLPPTIVFVTGAFLLGAIVRPGPLDVGTSVRIENPTGVSALRFLSGDLVSTVLSFVLIAVALLSVAASVHRYRRARGEERRQVRLFAYAALTAAVVLALSAAATAILGQTLLADLLFLAFFAVVGIGVPLAVGVAMLRYRLLEIEVVVRKTVVFAVLAAILTAIFLVVAASLGAAVGVVTDPRGASLAIVAAFLLGLLTLPLWRVSRRIADRVVFGGRKTPYEVLAEFSHGVSDTYSTEEVLPRMAEVVGAATGATRAVVWMRLGDQLRPGGTWPGDLAVEPLRLGRSGDAAFLDDEHAVEIRHHGEELGALSVVMPPSDPMNASKAKLIQDLARQAGPVVRNVRLIEDLRASRQRLVAAQDEERRRIERNIHDGAQQQLVALAVKLRLLSSVAERDGMKAKQLADQLRSETQDALENLRDLARGIYPPLLADQGLAAAIEAQARKSAVPVTVDLDGVGRYPQEAEAAAYFCILEALQNVAKYAAASQASVRLAEEQGTLRFEVEDDGRGFDPETTPRGAGLQNMADRLDALGGTLVVRSGPAKGTTVTGSIPVDR